MTIAIIPARGGSKRIPRKNIRPFNGVPIIAYSIQAALKSNLFHTVMVSTDDLEIKEIAESCGASVPFLRSEKTANDYAVLLDVIYEVVDAYKKLGREFDAVCNILPTSPLIKVDNLVAAHTMLMADSAVDSVLPIAPYSYPIQRALRIESGQLKMLHPELVNTRSNDLETCYHDAGQFFWVRSRFLAENKPLVMGNCRPLILSPMDVQDIDTEEDWKEAEFKMRVRESFQ